jgi:hypothetical protein
LRDVRIFILGDVPWERGAIVMSALQAGFSFVFKERVAMTIVVECGRMGLTLTIMKIKRKRNTV